jgi:hypothetical protein
MSTVEERIQMRENIKRLIEERERIGYMEGLRLLVSNIMFDHMMAECEQSDWDFMAPHPKWRNTPIIVDRRLASPGMGSWEFVVTYSRRLGAAALQAGRAVEDAIGVPKK